MHESISHPTTVDAPQQIPIRYAHATTERRSPRRCRRPRRDRSNPIVQSHRPRGRMSVDVAWRGKLWRGTSIDIVPRLSRTMLFRRHASHPQCLHQLHREVAPERARQVVVRSRLTAHRHVQRVERRPVVAQRTREVTAMKRRGRRVVLGLL